MCTTHHCNGFSFLFSECIFTFPHLISLSFCRLQTCNLCPKASHVGKLCILSCLIVKCLKVVLLDAAPLIVLISLLFFFVGLFTLISWWFQLWSGEIQGPEEILQQETEISIQQVLQRTWSLSSKEHSLIFCVDIAVYYHFGLQENTFGWGKNC